MLVISFLGALAVFIPVVLIISVLVMLAVSAPVELTISILVVLVVLILLVDRILVALNNLINVRCPISGYIWWLNSPPFQTLRWLIITITTTSCRTLQYQLHLTNSGSQCCAQAPGRFYLETMLRKYSRL